MKIKVISDEKQIIPRREIKAHVEFEGATPKRLDIKDKISSEIKGDKELLVVTKLKTTFKEQKGIVTCLQYDDEDTLKKIEYEYRLTKNSPPKKKGDDSEGDDNE